MSAQRHEHIMSFNPDGSASLTVRNSPVTVGAFTYGAQKIKVHEWGEGARLTIGKFCSLAEGLNVFLGGNHRSDWITTYPFGHVYKDALGTWSPKGHPATNGDVVIGNDVWIGQNVTVMSGVTIGSGAVIAANAHVVKDVPPYTVAGGNPAQALSRRFDTETIELLLALAWWDLPPETIRTIAPALCAEPDTATIRSFISQYRA